MEETTFVKGDRTVTTSSPRQAVRLRFDGYREVVVSVEEDTSSSTPDGPPPKGGHGSGTEEWLAYATANGVTVDLDATREEIIEALEASQIPTE
jgi:hypothetical protein